MARRDRLVRRPLAGGVFSGGVAALGVAVAAIVLQEVWGLGYGT